VVLQVPSIAEITLWWITITPEGQRGDAALNVSEPISPLDPDNYLENQAPTGVEFLRTHLETASAVRCVLSFAILGCWLKGSFFFFVFLAPRCNVLINTIVQSKFCQSHLFFFTQILTSSRRGTRRYQTMFCITSFPLGFLVLVILIPQRSVCKQISY
jgi:hypothetical protein